MVDYKSKYLEMKLNYINDKNKLKYKSLFKKIGGMQNVEDTFFYDELLSPPELRSDEHQQNVSAVTQPTLELPSPAEEAPAPANTTSPFGQSNCTYCGEPQSSCLNSCTQSKQSAAQQSASMNLGYRRPPRTAETKCFVCGDPAPRAAGGLDYIPKHDISHHRVEIPDNVTHVWACWACAH